MEMFRVYEVDWIEEYYKTAGSGGFLFTTEEFAKEFCDNLNNIEKVAHKIYERISNELIEYEEELEKDLKFLHTLDVPKWKAGIHMDEITKEMRDERNRIIKENERRLEENSKMYNEKVVKPRLARRDELFQGVNQSKEIMDRITGFFEMDSFLSEYEYEKIDVVR